MLGAIAGDIIGSLYEKRNLKRKDFSPLFHPKARFTDDTVCIVAVADALLNDWNPVDSLQDWGQRYEHVGGWGQRFAFWLVAENPQPYGSWGNGGAMRGLPPRCSRVALKKSWNCRTLSLPSRTTTRKVYEVLRLLR